MPRYTMFRALYAGFRAFMNFVPAVAGAAQAAPATDDRRLGAELIQLSWVPQLRPYLKDSLVSPFYGLCSIYHIGIKIGYGMWSQSYTSPRRFPLN